MQNLNRLETAKLLINTFYEETLLDTSLLDTPESANKKILADFELAKRMAFKCADMLHKEHIHKHPISWNIKRQQFYAEVKTLIESLTMRNVFESNRVAQR